LHRLAARYHIFLAEKHLLAALLRIHSRGNTPHGVGLKLVAVGSALGTKKKRIVCRPLEFTIIWAIEQSVQGRASSRRRQRGFGHQRGAAQRDADALRDDFVRRKQTANRS
jgi:hypothetical protein